MDLMVQEVNRQVREAAELALEAIKAVLIDQKVRTHGLTASQWAGLDEASLKLWEALG